MTTPDVPRRSGPRRHPAASPQQRGALLIEALVVILIFSFGLLGMLSLQARATKLAVASQDSGRAALMASELAAQMWAKRTVSVDSSVISAWQARLTSTDSDARLPGATGTVTPITSNGVAGASITITWKAPGATQANKYVTYVFVN